MKKLGVFQIIVMMILFAYSSLAAVIFTPAYPLLTREFHLSAKEAQWMMTLFLLGNAFGRLPYGPIANRFGRKKTLLAGLSISIIGTLFILVADSYFLICLGRFIQAIGCAAAMKIGYTIVGDLYTGSRATKVLAYSMLAYAILPAASIAVSGYLTPTYGWSSGFWFFLIFALFFSISCTLCLNDFASCLHPNFSSNASVLTDPTNPLQI